MTAALSDVTILAQSPPKTERPFFSICIPQYNRTSFLLEACKSIAEQSFRSFEICISDDRSTDGREPELINYLESARVDFTYARQNTNRRYDGNLRGSIALARGEYLFLLGNDDRLESPETLGHIHAELQQNAPVHVAIANYRELGTGRTFLRIPHSGILGEGPDAAVLNFRNFSFVSGVIFQTEAARRWTTTRWDGSEMYQMFIGCRILAAGGRLAGLHEICIGKDIQIPAETVDSYATRKISKQNFAPVSLPMAQIAPLVTDAVAPFVTPARREAINIDIGIQLLVFTYAFWLFELRRVQSWKYAASVYCGLGPKHILAGISPSALGRARLTSVWLAVGLAGLLTPVVFFDLLRPWFYRLAKRT